MLDSFGASVEFLHEYGAGPLMNEDVQLVAKIKEVIQAILSWQDGEA